jgi:hypothetical protein
MIVIPTRVRVVVVMSALALAAGLLTILILLGLLPSRVLSQAACTTIISSGSIQDAANNMGTGGVLCVRAGIYTENDKVMDLTSSGTASAPKTIMAFPGERPEFRGSINGSGSHWVIQGLFVDASYAPILDPGRSRARTKQAITWRRGTNLRFTNMELINRRPNGDPDLAGTCVYFGGGSNKPTNVTIESSSIHQCGQLPRDNLEHCVYAGIVSGLTLRDNHVYDCANRSIQLSPDTDNALVVGNLVDSGHQNGILLGDDADNDVVRNNVVNTPNGKTIYTGGTYSGSGNQVIDNCVWDTIVQLAPNVTNSGNVLADPQISGSKVTNPTCAAKLPAGSRFQAVLLGMS